MSAKNPNDDVAPVLDAERRLLLLFCVPGSALAADAEYSYAA